MLAFLTCEWTVVDRELHLHGRRIDRDEGKLLSIFIGGKRVSDVDVFDTGSDTDDTASAATFGVRCFQT